MKTTEISVPKKIADGEFNAGFMIEKEFMIFNKPVVFTTTNQWRPPTDVYETMDNFMIKMDISGIDTSTVKMCLRENVLVISGKRDFNTTHSNTHFYQVEIRYGNFEREISIPKPIIEDKIGAKYKDGLLIIHLPKADKTHYDKELSI